MVASAKSSAPAAPSPLTSRPSKLAADRTLAFSAILRVTGLALIALSLAASVFGAFGARLAAEPLSVDDYFRVKQISDLSMSQDGAFVAYATTALSLRENRRVREFHYSEARRGAKATLLPLPAEARQLAWIPGKREIAYLSADDGAVQVFSMSVETGSTRRLTSADSNVVSFAFSPEGERLAYLVQDAADTSSRGASLNRELTGEKISLRIDPSTANLYKFVDPAEPAAGRPPARILWIGAPGGEPFPVAAPGSVNRFHWSPGGEKLSLEYVMPDERPDNLSVRRTGLGVFDLASRRFAPVALSPGRGDGDGDGKYYLGGGEWRPSDGALLVKRFDPWLKDAAWTAIDAGAPKPAASSLHWRPLDMSYAGDITAAPDGALYLNSIVRGVWSLSRLAGSGEIAAGIFEGVEGAIKHVSFSADFQKAAFVNEDLARAPEIFVWDNVDGAFRLTALNDDINARSMAAARSVAWKSADGTFLQGWLLEPAPQEGGAGPWPLVTFVHGGPGLPATNEFAGYFFSYSGIWPYPLEVLAANGVAVFIPNYRGTRSFGARIQAPRATDREPVDDILTGIDHLVAEGIADPDRLGITGHSHGAWLGPLVMARSGRFAAASFAEGNANKVVNFIMMSEWINEHVHAPAHGGTLYDNPSRYMELSADLHFKGLSTAVLFEAGAQSLAIPMLGNAKAAVAAGMPTEFFVYPNTRHTSSSPAMQKDSAERNLAWFWEWLQEAPDGAAHSEGAPRSRKDAAPAFDEDSTQ